MLRAVDAERKQQVFRREASDLAATQAELSGARPQFVTELKLGEAPRRDSPVQLDDHSSGVAREGEVMLAPEQNLLLRLREIFSRSKTHRAEQHSGARGVARGRRCPGQRSGAA